MITRVGPKQSGMRSTFRNWIECRNEMNEESMLCMMTLNELW
jgi:hypothetical protein